MIVGICMVKDEADIIERTIRHMAEQLDWIVVSDNNSTDGTRTILNDLAAEGLPLSIQDDPEPGYYQSDKMSKLAAESLAIDRPDWIVPFDADERWIADSASVAELLASLPPEAMICEAAVIDHVATGDLEMPFRRAEQLPLRKVAGRAREGMVIHQGNHRITYPETEVPLAVTGKLEVRHYPYRSPEQFIRKARNGAAAYAATDLPEDVGAHWRGYGKLTDEQLREVFFEWFHSADPENDPTLVRDPCPTLLKQ